MSQRSKIPFLALTALLCLGLTSVSEAARGDHGVSANTLVRGPAQPEAGTWFWVKYFQCMAQETKGGADWATASDTCEALYPTDPPTPSDTPEVPFAPRMSSLLD